MAVIPQYEIKCGTCGYWMPAVGAATPTSDAPGPVGSVVQCRKCLQRTPCTIANLRIRAESIALA